jgi:hypothetical protein
MDIDEVFLWMALTLSLLLLLSLSLSLLMLRGRTLEYCGSSDDWSYFKCR